MSIRSCASLVSARRNLRIILPLWTEEVCTHARQYHHEQADQHAPSILQERNGQQLCIQRREIKCRERVVGFAEVPPEERIGSVDECHEQPDPEALHDIGSFGGEGGGEHALRVVLWGEEGGWVVRSRWWWCAVGAGEALMEGLTEERVHVLHVPVCHCELSLMELLAAMQRDGGKSGRLMQVWMTLAMGWIVEAGQLASPQQYRDLVLGEGCFRSLRDVECRARQTGCRQVVLWAST